MTSLKEDRAAACPQESTPAGISELIMPGWWAGIPHARWWAVATRGRIIAVFERPCDAERFRATIR